MLSISPLIDDKYKAAINLHNHGARLLEQRCLELGIDALHSAWHHFGHSEPNKKDTRQMMASLMSGHTTGRDSAAIAASPVSKTLPLASSTRVDNQSLSQSPEPTTDSSCGDDGLFYLVQSPIILIVNRNNAKLTATATGMTEQQPHNDNNGDLEDDDLEDDDGGRGIFLATLFFNLGLAHQLIEADSTAGNHRQFAAGHDDDTVARYYHFATASLYNIPDSAATFLLAVACLNNFAGWCWARRRCPQPQSQHTLSVHSCLEQLSVLLAEGDMFMYDDGQDSTAPVDTPPRTHSSSSSSSSSSSGTIVWRGVISNLRWMDDLTEEEGLRGQQQQPPQFQSPAA